MSNFIMFCIFLVLFIGTLFALMQIDFVIKLNSWWSRFWHNTLFVILYLVLMFLLLGVGFFAIKSVFDAFSALANLLSTWSVTAWKIVRKSSVLRSFFLNLPLVKYLLQILFLYHMLILHFLALRFA